jgi:flagellar protein FlaG
MDVRPTGSAVPAAAALPKQVTLSPAPAPAQPAVAPTQAATAVQQPISVSTPGELAQAVKNINKVLQEQARNLEFTVDSDSHRTIVKIVDQETKEVLRQIPNEETLEIARALDRVIGLLIRDKV